MKKILITGCSGFIGHHLIKEAQYGKWFVVGVDKRPIPLEHAQPDHFIQADVNDIGFRDLMDIDAVIHLAWRTNIPDCSRHPKESTRDNIDMTISFLEICKEAEIKKFIFPSTASLYSNNSTPWTEDMLAEPIEPYSWQKLSCEFACQMYAKQYGLPTVIPRFFQVFGEFQRADTALAAFIKNKKNNKPITLTKTTAQSSFKSGQRDFIYAGDLAKCVMKMVKSKNVGKGEIINVATGNVKTMEEVARTLKAGIKWIPKRPYEVERHEGDIKKARMLLEWEPEVNVIDWLKKIIK